MIPPTTAINTFATTALFDQFNVDRQRLRANLARALSGREQISLGDVVTERGER